VPLYRLWTGGRLFIGEARRVVEQYHGPSFGVEHYCRQCFRCDHLLMQAGSTRSATRDLFARELDFEWWV